MTKAILLSIENIRLAKEGITPLITDFLKLEPKNFLAIPETSQGLALINEAFKKLEVMGYTQEDSQLLISEVVEVIENGEVSNTDLTTTSNSFSDDNF